MSVASLQTREEKLSWFMRPLNWALYIVMIGFLALALPIWNEADFMAQYSEQIAYCALGTLVIAAGFLIWGIRRIECVVRGQ